MKRLDRLAKSLWRKRTTTTRHPILRSRLQSDEALLLSSKMGRCSLTSLCLPMKPPGKPQPGSGRAMLQKCLHLRASIQLRPWMNGESPR